MLAVLSLAAGYCAASCLPVGLAYAGVGPAALGKRPDGGRRPIGWLFYAQYLLATAGLFAVVKAVSREPAFDRVAANVDLGRRPDRRGGAWVAVVDLAAEFDEVPALRGPGYRSVPVLDNTAPTVDQLRAAVDAAYLLHAGLAADARDAVRRVRAARPGVRLNRAQRRALEVFAAVLPGERGA